MKTKRDTSIGKRYGRLVIVDRVFNGTRTMLHCKCDCGQDTVTYTGFIGVKTNSCGCLKKETALKISTHRLSGTPTYKSWDSMKRRCYVEHSENYKSYGGRGIKVCEKWQKFSGFLEDMGVRPDGMTLDRIDVNGNYEASNCRWATSKQQADNKTNTRYFVYKNETYRLTDFAKICNINLSTLSSRYCRKSLTDKYIQNALDKARYE